MKLVNADDVAPESVDWLWNERIPRGMISIFAGRPNQSKGLTVCHIAAEVSKMKFYNEDGSPRLGKVIYSAAEDSLAIMTRPRLEAAGALVSSRDIELAEFRLPVDFDALEARLRREPVDLLVLDPFASHLSGNVNRNSDRVRIVTDPLKKLLEEVNAACIVVDHVKKNVPRNSDPLAAIGGSGSGIVAASRMAFLIGIDPDDPDRRVLCNVKANICEKPLEWAFQLDIADHPDVGEVAYLISEGETTFDPMRFLTVPRAGEAKAGRPPEKRAAAADWLKTYLFDENAPVPAGIVFEEGRKNGIAQKTLRRAAADIEVVRNPPGGGHKCEWSLPDELRQLLEDANFQNAAGTGVAGMDDDSLQAWLND